MSDGTPASYKPRESVVSGFVLGTLLHILFQTAFLVLVATLVRASFAFVWVFYVYGLTQLVYMIPAGLIAWKRGATGVLKGLIISAAMTFLLNATCAGLMFLPRLLP